MEENSVLFVVKYTDIIQDNLKKKFHGQMSALCALGYKVDYFEWIGDAIVLKTFGENECVEILHVHRAKLTNEQYYHSIFLPDLYRASIQALKKKDYTFVYMRHMPFLPPAIKMAKLAHSKSKLIIEIPTYPIEKEKILNGGIIRNVGTFISNAMRKRVYRHVDLFAAIGENTGGVAYGRPAVNISNGIDVGATEKRVPSISPEEINILLLASMCTWHGFDRLIAGLSDYNKKEKIILHFVGNEGDGSLEKWKLMARKCEKGEIVFHGSLFGKRLNDMVNSCDIAIGSLGLYRNGIYEAGTLKAREYMSRGLPFVYAGKDFDIPNEFPYALEVPNDDTPIDIDQIVEFAHKVSTDSCCVDIMRQYAVETMSWESQLKKVIVYLEEFRHE